MQSLTSAVIAKSKPEEIKTIVNGMSMVELAETFNKLDVRARVAIFRMLEKRKALELFEHL
ncbi:MAG: hypothetical protein J7465_13685, partial [Chloroflexus sp.]|nr:hypothetical protein [Chloroflexus sp.]